MTIVRWLEPNGGGAETPGSVANSGRTLNSAASGFPQWTESCSRIDRHAAGIEPHHERWHGSGRHEGARAINVADRLSKRLGHVCAGVELQLDEPDALDRLAFDMLDAGDVEEMVFVIVDDEAFHLRGIKTAIRLREVDGRHAEIGKDIA